MTTAIGFKMRSGGETSSLLDLFFPVGSIYQSTKAADPSTFMGGTWRRLQDRFLLGAGVKAAGATGGAETHALAVSEIPPHNHAYIDTEKFCWNVSGVSSAPAWGDGALRTGARTGTTGGGAAHNNMPPYLVVYMWERTA